MTGLDKREPPRCGNTGAVGETNSLREEAHQYDHCHDLSTPVRDPHPVPLV